MTKNINQAGVTTDRHKDEFAIAAVLWAADRTLLAWVRTSLSLIGFGFLIHQASRYLKQEGLIASDSSFFGLALWVLGIIALIFSSLEYFSFRRRMLQNEPLNLSRRPLALIVAIYLCVAGSAGLIGFLALQLN